MKKSLLTIGAAVAFATGAFGQGAINIANGNGFFNTASSNPNDSGASGTYSDDIDATITLEVFAQTSAADASLASQAAAINADDASLSTVLAGAALLQADFTQMTFGTSLGSETLQNSFTTSFGQIVNTGTYDVGQASGQYALANGAVGEYAILAMTTISGKTYEGYLVLNAGGPLQMGGGSNPAYQMNGTSPGNQNILLAPVPEPTTLALAGLGGLSLLALRRRKA